MRGKGFCVMFVVLLGVASIGADASAESEIVMQGMVTYIDANGMYTIAGNVKNNHQWAVMPKLVLHVQDGGNNDVMMYAIEIPYNIIPAGGEIPFKAKVPGASRNATLESHQLSATKAPEFMQGSLARNAGLLVMYDHTLIVYPNNGSMRGTAVNAGNTTLHDIVLWAVVHGENDSVLDVARSAPLGTIWPGQTVAFEMHPDPVISGVSYYSCFAPTNDSVVPLYVKRGDQEYNMRYEAGAWLYKAVFSEDGSSVTMNSTNSYPFETYANLEIPAVTRAEDFDVSRNGEQIKHTQSIDEMGLWHLSFEIRTQSQDVIRITGFEQGPLLSAIIPDYMRDDLRMWVEGETGDAAMYEIMVVLSDRELLPKLVTIAEVSGEQRMPEWLKTVVGWWVRDGVIDDGVALAAISYVVEEGLVVVE